MTIAIVYNSTTITEAQQLGKIKFDEGYDKATVTVEFVLEADTATALTTACNALRAALTVWDAKLELTFGGTWLSFDPADGTNTGFLARPTLREVGSNLDTETSRHYEFTCTVDKPASDGGRRSAQIAVTWDEYRRRSVSLSAEYTATSTGSAYANATTNGPTWAASVLSDLGITNTDRSAETVQYEHRNKLAATYRLDYDEQIEADSAAGHTAGVINSKLDFQLEIQPEIGTSPLLPISYAPPVVVTASYSGTLVSSSWSAGVTAQALYIATIRPWLISRAREVLGVGATASLTGSLYPSGGETFRASRSTGQFSGTIVMLLGGNSPIESYSEEISQNGNVGVAAEKLYDGVDHTWATWGTGAQLFATQSVTIKQRDSTPTPPEGLAAPWVQHGEFGEHVTASSRGVGSVSLGAGVVSATIVYVKTFTRRYRYELAGGQSATITAPGASNKAPSASAGLAGPTFRADNAGGIALLGNVAGK